MSLIKEKFLEGCSEGTVKFLRESVDPPGLRWVRGEGRSDRQHPERELLVAEKATFSGRSWGFP